MYVHAATDPMNMKTNIPAVISAPRDAGDSIPNIARTTTPTSLSFTKTKTLTKVTHSLPYITYFQEAEEVKEPMFLISTLTGHLTRKW